MDIKNTVALVTGAGSGLGLATCKALVNAGAKVMAVDLDYTRLVREMASLGDSVRALKVDVANDASVKVAVEFAVNTFGALHVAVNCAGILGPCKTLSKGELFPLDLWDRVIGVNLTGTFNVIRHAALAMSQNDENADGERGVIINTSSGAAWQGQMGQAAYSASKPAVMRLTLPVARDLAQHGVRVVTLAPGLFETGMSAGMPIKVAQNIIEKFILFPNRMGQAQEFSALVRHVVENAYLNATTLNIDGGARL